MHLYATETDHPQLKAFPAATEGSKRFVIVLPHKERGEEAAYQLELIPGKIQLTDGVNKFRLGTGIESRPLKGWGYTYYEVTGEDATLSTLMAAPEGQAAVEQFVSGRSILIRYNSRLPVVIYAPEDYEIRYRLWQTSETFETANEN